MGRRALTSRIAMGAAGIAGRVLHEPGRPAPDGAVLRAWDFKEP